ncbi:MAG: SusC/RagA family TonB-linked outer membrane protein [Bacteroidota bacterium]
MKILGLLFLLSAYSINSLLAVQVQDETLTISGKIIDSEGKQGIPGVTVLVKGTTKGTITDVEGTYKISGVTKGDVLVFSYVGFLTQERTVLNSDVIDVEMGFDMVGLEEIVVVGYGTQKKSDITGSVASFDTETLENRPQVNLTQALQGNIAGVTVTTNTSSAEDGGTILIRGQNSITAANDPLIVLDGIIYDGSLSDLNPNDIQSMEVLKDASSTAIYGSRGANGVILVATKKGKAGDLKVSYNAFYSFDNVAQLPDLQNASEFWRDKWERSVTNQLSDPANADTRVEQIVNSFFINNTADAEAFMTGYPDRSQEELINEILSNYGESGLDRESVLSLAEDFAYPTGARDTDWIDLASRTGHRQEHNLSVSGGSDKADYFVSATHTDVQGIAEGDDFERTILRFNLGFDLTNGIKYGTNTQIGLFDRSGVSADWGNSGALRFSPLYQPFNDDGSLRLRPDQGDGSIRNPLERTLYENEDKEVKLITNQYINVEIPYVDGLEYKLNFGYQRSGRTNRTYKGRNTIDGEARNGELTIVESMNESWLVENILSYKRDFGRSSVFLTGLYSLQERVSDVPVNLTARGFPNDIRDFYQLQNATFILPFGANVGDDFETGDLYSQRNNISQMIRANYTFDDRYLLTATVRRDGFSAFGEDFKFGSFPSLALGWNISNEQFFNTSTIDALKLRLSYGENGNEAVTPYSSLALLQPLDYISESEDPRFGFYPQQLANPSLSWETTKSFNIGTDFSIYEGRVSGSLDVFFSNTLDLLLDETISPINGVTEIRTNVGETENRGFEFQLNTYVLDNQDFTWKAGLVGSRFRSEIVDVNQRDADGQIIDDVASEWFIGHPVNVFFDYSLDRILQPEDFILDANGNYEIDEDGNYQLLPEVAESLPETNTPRFFPGQPIVRDVNGDGEIGGAEDRIIHGDENPTFTAGLTNTVTYKNWTFSMLLNGLWGATRRNTLVNNNGFGPRRKLNIDYWSDENPTNELPGLNRGSLTPGIDLYPYVTVNYVRIQDISIAYRIPTDNLPLTSLEVYSNIRNLYTFTNWEGLDPDFNTRDNTFGRPSNDIPRPRSFILGVRVTF